ncbi:MAG: hypothetical protein CL707_08620 [Chloroflexi bacterium]|nr:hypothetical protein [Chloroflexota bacterium]|tara:strand:+ start:4505 stop:4696 length:192 start_codon:yes stop_codon:yes gene_type:complete
MKQSTIKSQLRELELNLPDEIIVKLALDAHKRDVSLNSHIIDILKRETKNNAFDGSPQLLTEN